MTKLIEIKNKVIDFIGEYDTYFRPLFKFILAFAVFMVIRGSLGFAPILRKPAVNLLLALICALLPVNAVIWFSAILILYNVYTLSLIVAAMLFVVFAIVYFVYFRFTPKDGVAALITPIAFRLHVPYIMPIGTGLLRGPYSIISVLCGTIMYYLLAAISQNASLIAEMEADEESGMTDKLKAVLSQVSGTNSREMVLIMVVFAVTGILVYMIRRIKADHAWTLALISGVLVQLLGLFVGFMFMSVSADIFWLLMGNIIALVIGFLLQFIFMDLDYSRVERVQFEDDDYYYYVKAVPKKKVANEEKTVKHFGGAEEKSAKKSKKEEEENRAIADELEIDENLLN